jgi:hypothetical protein
VQSRCDFFTVQPKIIVVLITDEERDAFNQPYVVFGLVAREEIPILLDLDVSIEHIVGVAVDRILAR